MTGFVPWGPDFFHGAAGSLNLQFNQGIEDLRARANFWQVPDFNMGLCSYPGLASGPMDILLDPCYTIGQIGFNGGFSGGNNMNSIFPGFNAGINMLAPGYGVGNLGSAGGAGNAGGGSSSASKTKEEKLMNIENKNIVALLEKLAKSNVLDSDAKDLLNEDLKEAKKIKSAKDKNEQLKEIYNEYKSEIKNFLVSHASKSIVLKDNQNLDNALDAIGYERSDSKIETEGHISELKKAIDGLGKDQGSMSISNIAKTMGETRSDHNVLDVISSYNTAYPDKNLAAHISEKYKSFSKSDKSRDMNKELETFGKQIAERLAEAAEKELEYVEDETVKNSLKEKIDKVRTLELKDSDYVSKFNELYAITRILAARNLGNQLEAKYGKIDSETFKENMFLDSTKDDLSKEFKGAYDSSLSTIETVTLKKQVSNHTLVVENKDNKVDDNAKFDKKFDSLKKSSLEEKTDKVKIDDEEYTVYEEKTGSKEDGSKRQYVVVDEKFYEVITDEEGKTAIAEDETKASDIQKAVKAADDKIEAGKKAAADEEKALRDAEKNAITEHFKRNNIEVTLEDTNETKVDSEGNTVPVYKMKKPTGDVVKVYFDSDGSLRTA